MKSFKSTCPRCEGAVEIYFTIDTNYGADADGRRGTYVEFLEEAICENCGDISDEISLHEELEKYAKQIDYNYEDQDPFF